MNQDISRKNYHLLYMEMYDIIFMGENHEIPRRNEARRIKKLKSGRIYIYIYIYQYYEILKQLNKNRLNKQIIETLKRSLFVK